MFIFLTARAIMSVLRVLEKRETSAAKARTRDARANRETGFGKYYMIAHHIVVQHKLNNI